MTEQTTNDDETYSSDDPVTTKFMDMHSGGRQKTEFSEIFVELPEDAAYEWFAKEFSRDPSDVTCHCCGPDFSVMQFADLQQATAYRRNCEYVTEDGTGLYIEEPLERHGRETDHIPFEEYIENAAQDRSEYASNGALVITAESLGEAWADEVTINE